MAIAKKDRIVTLSRYVKHNTSLKPQFKTCSAVIIFGEYWRVNPLALIVNTKNIDMGAQLPDS